VGPGRIEILEAVAPSRLLIQLEMAGGPLRDRESDN
jgi:hypothetical protein